MSKLEIYCPKCGRLIINANDFAGSYLEKKCRKCKKLVIYTPEDGRVVSKDIPPRNTSSGMRFY